MRTIKRQVHERNTVSFPLSPVIPFPSRGFPDRRPSENKIQSTPRRMRTMREPTPSNVSNVNVTRSQSAKKVPVHFTSSGTRLDSSANRSQRGFFNGSGTFSTLSMGIAQSAFSGCRTLGFYCLPYLAVPNTTLWSLTFNPTLVTPPPLPFLRPSPPVVT